MPTQEINGKQVSWNVSRYHAQGSIPNYINKIRSEFSKIGIQEPYLEIRHGGSNGMWASDGWCEVLWMVNGEEYSYKCDSQPRAVDNVAAIAQVIEYESRAIRRGIKSFGQVMSQFRIAGPSNYKDPWQTLGVDKKIRDKDFIKFKFKQLSKEHHPDNGGDADKFKAIKEAYDTIMKELG